MSMGWITDEQIRDLQAALFAGAADERQLSGLVACHDALGRSHRRPAARAHCAKLYIEIVREENETP